MKTILKIILLSSICCFLFLSTNCKKRVFSKITFEGTVYDHKTNGSPVEGIKITLKACGGGSSDASKICEGNHFIIGEAISDASGHFHIHERAARSDIYFVYTSVASVFSGINLYNPGDGVYGKDLNSRFSNIYLAP